MSVTLRPKFSTIAEEQVGEGEGAPEGPWTRRGVPVGDYMPRVALVVTHFFLSENRHVLQSSHLLVLL